MYIYTVSFKVIRTTESERKTFSLNDSIFRHNIETLGRCHHRNGFVKSPNLKTRENFSKISKKEKHDDDDVLQKSCHKLTKKRNNKIKIGGFCRAKDKCTSCCVKPPSESLAKFKINSQAALCVSAA